MVIVRLKKGRARPFWFGCPIVFSGAVESVQGEATSGSLVEVRDFDDHVIGHGFYNPNSLYRVRMVRLERPGEPRPDVSEILRMRLTRAFTVRSAFGLPSSDVNAWRLVNSEGDQLSGLVVDLYRDVAVIQISARWVQVWRDAVIAAIREVLGPSTRVVSKLSGLVRGPEGLEAEPGFEIEPIEIVESGISYMVDIRRGQKTGFFIDQRDNRQRLRSLVAGKRVLDAFCYTGGFSLQAAAGGAEAVLGVDTSATAISNARINAQRNSFAKVRFEVADAFEVLTSGQKWDVVVCDPPRLASGREDLEAASHRYKKLNRLAIGALEEGGILVTCSCSSTMKRDHFVEVLRDAATEAHRTVTICGIYGAACDHPIHPSWPDGEYLKCIVAYVA